jgi:hypothetical protein
MEKQVKVKSFLNKISYYYMFRILEVLFVMSLAFTMPIFEFGVAFLSLVFMYFFMYVLDFRIVDNDQKSLKKYCNNLSVLFPLKGVFAGLCLLGLSYVFPSLELALRLSAIVAFFMSLKSTPEVYYKLIGQEIKVYRSYFISQVVLMMVVSISLYFVNTYVSVIIGYALFFAIMMVLLWKDFPYKLKPKVNKVIIAKIVDEWRQRLFNRSINNLLEYGLLIYVALVYGIKEFATVYFVLLISNFFYRRVTIFFSRMFKNKFENISYDMFKLNMVRIIEYIAFISAPLSIIFFAFSFEFGMLLNYPRFFDIIYVFMIAGLVKTLFETGRIALQYEKKEYINQRIMVFELILLLILVPILNVMFGLFGIAVGYFIASVLSSLLYVLLAERITKLNLLTVSRDYFYILFSAIISSILIAMIKEWYPIRNIWTIMLFGLIGLAIYIGLTFVLNQDLYKRFTRFVFDILDEE